VPPEERRAAREIRAPGQTARSAPLRRGGRRTERPDLPRAALKHPALSVRGSSPHPLEAPTGPPHRQSGRTNAFSLGLQGSGLRGPSHEPPQPRLKAFGHPPEPRPPEHRRCRGAGRPCRRPSITTPRERALRGRDNENMPLIGMFVKNKPRTIGVLPTQAATRATLSPGGRGWQSRQATAGRGGRL
jgi:hypothetical protein